MDGLNLPTISGDVRERRFSVASPQRARPPAWRRVLRWMPFTLAVIVPTALASFYYFTIAADQYVSEARFVVRSAGGGHPSGLGTLLQGAGVTRADDDTYAVQEYITSRDALRKLSDMTDVRAMFARPEADALARFPSPFPFNHETFEHLYKYYGRHVEALYDSTTGVTDLTVRAFRAEDAELLAKNLLAASEQLVNQMNDRQRENALRDARREVELAEARVQAVAVSLAEFRNREALLDPDKQSVAMLKLVNDLEIRQNQLKLQLSELTKSSPQSPLIAVNQRRIDILQGQINDARSRITGSDRSMVPKLTEFDALTLDKGLADKRLISATASLEVARINAERQQLYLDTVVMPNLSDYAAYPKRFASIAIVFATCFGLYTIAALLIAGALEHRSR